MTKQQAVRLGKPLTQRQLGALVREHQRWLDRPDIKALREAARRSTQLTAEDYSTRLNFA